MGYVIVLSVWPHCMSGGHTSAPIHFAWQKEARVNQHPPAEHTPVPLYSAEQKGARVNQYPPAHLLWLVQN
jgi:hypothetical protein